MTDTHGKVVTAAVASDEHAQPPPHAKPRAASPTPPRTRPRLPPWLDARFATDASRTSVLLIILVIIASANAPELASPLPMSTPSLLRSFIMWVGVTVAVAHMSLVGATSRRCAEQVAGTLVGGSVGVVVAEVGQPAVTALGAVVAALASEAFGRGGACDAASKLTLATFCIVALPALLDTPAEPSEDVRAHTGKIAAARLGAILAGVCMVAVASVVWFPSAASEEALAAAQGAGDELCVLARDAVAPLWSDDHEEKDDGGKDGGAGNDDAGVTSHPAPPKQQARSLLRRELVHADVRRVRAKRNALTAALAQARFETLVARVPVRRGRRVPTHKDGSDVECGCPRPPLPSHITFAIYLPLSPRYVCIPHHTLPLAELAAVEAALGRVALGLQAVAATVKSGFGRSLMDAVRHRYAGRDPVNSAEPLAALAQCIVKAVDEAASMLRAVRTAWRHGSWDEAATGQPPGPCFAAYTTLHDEISWIVQEHARLDAGHRQTWQRFVQGDKRRPREPAAAMVRIEPTQEGSLESARWLAFLWEVCEVDRALEELDGAVKGLAERVVKEG